MSTQDAREQFSVEKRLGYMAEALVVAKVGPSARFFTRKTVDEMILLMREAEKAIVGLRADLRSKREEVSR